MLPIGVLILPYFVLLMVQTPLEVPPVPGIVIPPGGGVNAFAAAGNPRATAVEIPMMARESFMVAFLMTCITQRVTKVLGVRK